MFYNCILLCSYKINTIIYTLYITKERLSNVNIIILLVSGLMGIQTRVHLIPVVSFLPFFLPSSSHLFLASF